VIVGRFFFDSFFAFYSLVGEFLCQIDCVVFFHGVVLTFSYDCVCCKHLMGGAVQNDSVANYVYIACNI
jgi:hypothetical protein